MSEIINRNQRNPHRELFEDEQPVVNYPKTKKVKWEDRYTRATFYVQNDVLDDVNRMAGTEKGEKTRIINEALQNYLRTHNR